MGWTWPITSLPRMPITHSSSSASVHHQGKVASLVLSAFNYCNNSRCQMIGLLRYPPSASWEPGDPLSRAISYCEKSPRYHGHCNHNSSNAANRPIIAHGKPHSSHAQSRTWREARCARRQPLGRLRIGPIHAIFSSGLCSPSLIAADGLKDVSFWRSNTESWSKNADDRRQHPHQVLTRSGATFGLPS